MKILLKNKLRLFGLFMLVSLMVSCFDDNTVEELVSITDAELLYFALRSDSVPGLSKVVFTIDQRSGRIYNNDSMPFLTQIKEKVIVDYINGIDDSFTNVLNITNLAEGDSIWINRGDSIDMSTPQTLRVYALDGVTTKTYIAQLNIHQIDPDSIQYQRLNTGLPFLRTEDTKTVEFNNRFLAYSKIANQIQLHSSTDAVNWTQETAGLPANAVIREIRSNGEKLFAFTDDGELYVRHDIAIDQWILVNKPAEIKVKSILGYLNASREQPEGLSLVVETLGKNVFAFTEDFIQWEYDETASVTVPDDFPLYGFSTHSYQIMLTERISIFGGISQNGTVQNTVWSTVNGHYWAKLTGNVNVFPPLEGANVFYYDNEFWLINGKLNKGYNEKIYCSTDGGVTWWIKEKRYWELKDDEESKEERWTHWETPENFPLRYNASLVMDKDRKWFYIIGGKQNAVLDDVWKGFLNRMEFKK
jgi:hypothetical protein